MAKRKKPEPDIEKRPDPYLIEGNSVTLPPQVAAIVLMAGTNPSGFSNDINNNEAQRDNEGGVRLSLYYRNEGHKRLSVILPDSVVFQILPIEEPTPEEPEEEEEEEEEPAETPEEPETEPITFDLANLLPEEPTPAETPEEPSP